MQPLGTFRFDEFLAATAAKSPTPGGGAVAAATGATASALAGMVVSYSLGKKDLVQHESALQDAKRHLERARAVFLELATEDAEAYAWLNALQKLPETDAKRAAEFPAAVSACIQVPMATLAAAVDIARLCETLCPITNTWLRSDLQIAAILADAAARASVCNVRINTPLIPDSMARTKLEEQATRLAAEAARVVLGVQTRCA
ncbi:MAG: cyclodeaminase/cyclohydrolase family protein [Phycisphaerales bacterium]